MQGEFSAIWRSILNRRVGLLIDVQCDFFFFLTGNPLPHLNDGNSPANHVLSQGGIAAVSIVMKVVTLRMKHSSRLT